MVHQNLNFCSIISQNKNCMTTQKTIIFIDDEDWVTNSHHHILHTHEATSKAIQNNEPLIYTTSLCNADFAWLLEHEYTVKLLKFGKCLEIYPGMPLSDKEIRKEHNLTKLFAANYFDYIFDVI